jgi:hypothetical protein
MGSRQPAQTIEINNEYKCSENFRQQHFEEISIFRRIITKDRIWIWI